MREIFKEETLDVPSNVQISTKARTVTVTGPRGTLTKSIKHMSMDLNVVRTKKTTIVRFVVWNGGRKHVACLRTVKSMVENMITGVTKGFLYKMKSVYAHFPVNIIIDDDKHGVEIRNFLGEKLVRKIPMLDGVEVVESGTKDEISISGNDIDNVSQSAANIHQSCLVKNKGKFLDGIYVSSKETVVQDEA